MWWGMGVCVLGRYGVWVCVLGACVCVCDVCDAYLCRYVRMCVCVCVLPIAPVALSDYLCVNVNACDV